MRTKRKGEFSLQLHASKRMRACFFFAGGHWNYARDSICYLRSMEKLSGDILNKFMKGEHIMRNQKRLWEGI